jgi:pimeloyl-ACP methyl ester carboxylesterase
MSDSLTAENRLLVAEDGVTYAYRRFGDPDAGSPPLVFLQHFRGNLDNWDPLLVDALAARREVVLLDNAGVGLSSGSVPRTVTAMARHAIAFLDALDLTRIDLLGFSLGGFVAQELTLLRPRLVRRLVLAGTGPQGGGVGMHGWIHDVAAGGNHTENSPDDLLWLMFAPSESSQQKGREFLGRFIQRQEGRDKPNGPEVTRAQYDAMVEWGTPTPAS